MSNLPQQITINQYLSVGATVYSYTYYIPFATDINVYDTPFGNVPVPADDLLVLNVDYTVQGAGTLTGGTITLLFTPPTGDVITLSRNVLASIDTNFSEVQTINGQNLDTAFARNMLVSQQIETIMAFRNITYAIDSYLPIANADTVLPKLGNQQIWQKVGGAIQAVTLQENPDVSTLRSQLLSTTPGSDGTSIIGYYDPVTPHQGTLAHFLNNLFPFLTAQYIDEQFFLDTGIVNNIVVTLPASYTAYRVGTKITVRMANTNTGHCTINVNSLGAVPIVTSDGIQLGASQLLSGYPYVLIFVNTFARFVVMNPAPLGIFLRTYAGASAYNTVDQSIGPSSSNKIIFSNTEFDNHVTFDAVNSALIATMTGIYEVNCKIPTHQDSPTGGPPAAVYIYIFVNNVSYRILDLQVYTSSNNVVDTLFKSSLVITLNDGDSVTLVMQNGITDAVNMKITSSPRALFQLTYLGS